MAEEKGEPQQAVKGGGRRKFMLLGGALMGIMAVEGLVVFILVKQFTASPATAEASDPHGLKITEGEKKPQEIEVSVVKLRAQNERSQRQIIYDMDVFVSISDAEKDKVTEVLQRRKATIQDRLTRVIRASEPERFTEPDLRTLRKQFQNELNQIVGDEKLILEVLIPSIVSSEN